MGARLIICGAIPEIFFAAVSYISSHYVNPLLTWPLKPLSDISVFISFFIIIIFSFVLHTAFCASDVDQKTSSSIND